jgi:alkylation response protein AidB-like acyl-CoA dehydrogenase
LHPYPEPELDREAFVEFYSRLEHLLDAHVDAADIDRSGEYPPELVDELKDLGAFGMKIPEEYDGLGFSQPEYSKALELVGRYDSNLVALLSAHQSIGVPQPLKLFGTEAQKKKYLPRCANEWISAFALTEPRVGSDPARLTTSYEHTDDGDFVLDGEKLWCTNGTFGDVFIVMAKHHESDRISAFVVEADWEGVETPHRCRFMGLRALENGVVTLDEVHVPEENLVGEEGAGLKIALTTLNTGRLSLPAAAVGTVKGALEVCREWCNERVQWGQPVGRHEAVAHMLTDVASRGWAMECLSDVASQLATREDYDIRLVAAAAKEWNSARQWEAVDDTMQIRGGRGYETEHSLEARGERPVPCERMMRDARINRIFEGSSEIMHLFMAREAVDTHLEVAGVLVEPDASIGDVVRALPSIVFFYAWWYTSRWFGTSVWPKYAGFGDLGRHLRFAERASRRLARNIFHGMVVHRAELEKKQAFMSRAVDIGMEIFVMAATISRTRHLIERDDPRADRAEQLTDLFCREATRRIRDWFEAMWSNDDAFKYEVARDVLEGEYEWLEDHGVEVDEAVARAYEPELETRPTAGPPDEQAAE